MTILEEAKQLQKELISHRRFLHAHAEIGLDLPMTSAYVKEQLTAAGITPVSIGTSGITALIGGRQPGKTILIRGDMDALPIQEENECSFLADTGNMHACGHDFHTAMLLGAAKLLKIHENELCGTVKLMFQPGEETSEGAKLMIKEGILNNPPVDAAMMIHVITGTGIPTGTVVVSPAGTAAAAADWFTIHIKGKGSHGAMPEKGIDPLHVISQIFLSLQEINAREIAAGKTISLTIGQMHGGHASNVIPDTAYLSGTIRTQDTETKNYAKQRVTEIAEGIAATFRAKAEINFDRGCPVMQIDRAFNEQLKSCLEKILPADQIIDRSAKTYTSRNMASEDFSYLTELIPSTAFNLGAGAVAEGFHYPLHHPKVTFHEEALAVGTAVYAGTAIEWLKSFY